jgi:hypothetical protein
MVELIKAKDRRINMTKFVTALLGLLGMAVIASRQLFLFAVSGNPLGFPGSSAGRYHLWLSLGASVAASCAGALMFRFFALHETKKWATVGMSIPGPLAVFTALHSAKTPAPARFDLARWALANPWLAEGQPDDRLPMDGSVRNIGVTPSEQRSFARRTHQLMFKKWSQARHD